MIIFGKVLVRKIKYTLDGFLLLKKLSIGFFLSSINIEHIICDLCNKPKDFEQLFFYCVYAKKVWSIFIGLPINVEPIICDVCNKPEDFEHLFFYCVYAKQIWSIFLGLPIEWNKKYGLSWSEILARYVEYFDFFSK